MIASLPSPITDDNNKITTLQGLCIQSTTATFHIDDGSGVAKILIPLNNSHFIVPKIGNLVLVHGNQTVTSFVENVPTIQATSYVTLKDSNRQILHILEHCRPTIKLTSITVVTPAEKQRQVDALLEGIDFSQASQDE